MEVTFNRRVRIIRINGISYILDDDLPHISHDLVEGLGITLRKGRDQDMYLSLIE